jgi:hypothetical protein
MHPPGVRQTRGGSVSAHPVAPARDLDVGADRAACVLADDQAGILVAIGERGRNACRFQQRATIAEHQQRLAMPVLFLEVVERARVLAQFAHAVGAIGHDHAVEQHARLVLQRHLGLEHLARVRRARPDPHAHQARHRAGLQQRALHRFDFLSH